MHKIRPILSHPAFIALAVTATIIPFLPDMFDKYKTELVDSNSNMYHSEENSAFYYYNDLDNDGKSEKLAFKYGTFSPNFVLYDNNDAHICQRNWEKPLQKNCKPCFGDYDNNGLNEVYWFTQKENAIFLQAIEMQNLYSKDDEKRTADSIIKETLADTVWRRGSGAQFEGGVTYAQLIDLNGDGYRDLVFNINTGLALQPRNLYAYDIKNNTLHKSPKSGAAGLSWWNFPGGAGANLCDLNSDGKLEIIAGSNASGNIEDTTFLYSDESAWLMVFDHTMNFFFNPVEFPLFTSKITAVPFFANNKPYIAALYTYVGVDRLKPALCLFNAKGEKVREKVFDDEDKKAQRFLLSLGPKKRNRLYITDINGDIAQLNENLDTVKTIKIQPIGGEPYVMDIDNDQEEELIFPSQHLQKLIIARSDFSHPITVDVPNEGKGELVITVKQNGAQHPNLSVQYGKNWYLFSYLFNRLYYLKYLIYSGVYLGLFLFIFGVQKVGAYKLEQDNKRLEKTVAERTAKVVRQKEIIEEKNKDITDSIRYAKRIQDAMLKEEEHVSEHLPEHFILFMPKDIVSGDFHWGLEKNEHWYLAAVDCTGHGVPGAFMSMLGMSFLNDIAATAQLHTPAEILNELRHRVMKELRQTGKTDDTQDGMDISLIRLNLQTKELQWAGAYNSLNLIINNELKEIKGDKQPIGFYPAELKPFTNHTIDFSSLPPGGSGLIYIFSDGYADQFGGPKEKKFGYKRLEKLVLDNSHLPMTQQKDLLKKAFTDWMGELEQTDDVCVIGVRINT